MGIKVKKYPKKRVLEMGEEKENNEGKNFERTVVSETIRITNSVDVTKQFSTSTIQKFLNANQYAIALLLASTRVERILIEKIKKELNLSDENIEKVDLDKAGLGTYRKWCKRLYLIDEEHLTPTANLRDKRNKLVHEDGYLQKLKNQDEEKKAVANILNNIIEYIESEEI
ncbi:hypothetical protein [Methanonatronarchaeum sp. AMET-Sl]|uniref:hypothetical protein n=1 Tax=Methanonatronarchaeum sp. AMET-Sl TaxID=3037654 RepID=UPI00244DDAD1|nr:hypothetical protein [Methanonatronarchaeum sp. AMET-Sl]WGI17153.1 hypothetical protein QEN48_06535 [Methanonatronarchaeum sp. AMET-Sl]